MGLGQDWRDLWVYRTGLEGSMDVGQDSRYLYHMSKPGLEESMNVEQG